MKLVAVLNRGENSKEIDKNYLNAISNNGGVPILINKNNLCLLKLCGGVLLTGGDMKIDLDDYFISYALENKLPILGICQGMQSMALYDTNNNLVDILNHYNCNHTVILTESKLKNIVHNDKLIVNSYHHQQVLASNKFKIVGYSLDGVIEAIESYNNLFQIGVEWHPERDNSIESELLFKEFLQQIKETL